MKSLFRYTLCLVLVFFVWASCTDGELVESGTVGCEKVAVTFNFTAQDNDRITVTTRATLEEIPESRVQNFFLFFFVNGTRIYSHYFDNENKLNTVNEVIASDENNWYVQNKSDNDDEDDITEGTVRAHVPQAVNATLYMVANIDADMVNISPEKLNTIRSEQELTELTATLNQEITSRNGYFPMSAKIENVTIDPATSSGIIVNGATANAVLHRLDAKVEVYVRTATDYETENTVGGVTTKQTLKGFVPESWRVVNLPKSCYVVGRATSENNYDCTTEYFQTSEVAFESSEEKTFTDGGKTYSTTLHGFSFYMMENRPKALASVNSDFHLRDMRKKDATTGKYINDENGEPLWKYAPSTATYLEIKGEVEMDVDVSSEAKTQTLKAAVTYYVHLGDIASDLDDYSVNRNTHYKYTITIKGVDKITLEVETSQLDGADKVKEENAGATGNVYIAKESIHTFDAHYGQRVFCFDAAYIEAENMTWFVQTPFGKVGTPPSMDGVDIPAGYDYKWVEFLVNEEIESVTDELGKTLEVYSQKNQTYPGYKGNPNNTKSNDLMDVIAFTKYVKEEKIKLDKYLNEETATNTSVFRQEFDKAWYDKFGAEAAYRWRIYVTVFVNEFYYEEHPITGDSPTDLWKQFVNQPNRIMHILCDDQMSLDEASTSTGSVVTIRQRSIQTPYNMNNEGLMTAWGCETEDERTDAYYGFYETTETPAVAPTASKFNVGGAYDLGNDSPDNGLFNTVCLWNLRNGNSFKGSEQWSTYLDYERENDHELLWMKSNYAVLRWSTLMRNRDNNGNGLIDADEVRWYLASKNQILGLFLGEQGIPESAKLYDKKYAVDGYSTIKGQDYRTFRRHVVSSSKCAANESVLDFWIEQGIVTTQYRIDSYNGYGNPFKPYLSVRCVRNLGIDNVTESNIINGESNLPDPLVKCTKESTGTNAVFKFDLRNINEKSLRFYTTRELEAADENSEMARTYKGFVTGGVFYNIGVHGATQAQYKTLKDDYLDVGESPVTDSDYRVPNIREGALMTQYCTDATWWGSYATQVSTYASLGTAGGNGVGGSGLENGNSWCFGYGDYIVQNENVHSNKTVIIRAVRDWDPASEE